MRFVLSLLLLSCCSTICLAHTDSLFIEKMDGTVIRYSIITIQQISSSGIPTGVKEQEFIQNVLSSFAMEQNYPNPFNPSTTIQFSVPAAGHVEARIFDIRGRLVRSLSNSYRQAGTHALVWDSRSNSGTVAASGTYFCQVLFNETVLVKKLVLLK